MDSRIRQRRAKQMTERAFDWGKDWDRIRDCGDPRLVLLEGFRVDPDTGYKPEGTTLLCNVRAGARFEDAEGNRFRKMVDGPVQSSVVIRDRNRQMYMADVGIIVQPLDN